MFLGTTAKYLGEKGIMSENYSQMVQEKINHISKNDDKAN